MHNSKQFYSILCIILVVCASYAAGQPIFQQPGAPNIGGFPQGNFPQGGFPQGGFPQGPGAGGFPQAQGPALGGYPQGPGAAFPVGGVGGANAFNPYNSFGSNVGGLGGFPAGNPGLSGQFGAGTPNIGGFGVPNARGGGFGAATPTLAGFNAGTPNFGNAGFGQPVMQSAAPFRAANAPTYAAPATFQANPLTSVFGGGQNIGAGMTVDQMRTLDNALFGNRANIFQTEQPSATFSYPLNQGMRQTTTQDSSNTYTTQQFGAGPFSPNPGLTTPGLGVGGPGSPVASPSLNSALLNGVAGGMNPYGYGQQLQANPAYSSISTGFNDLLSGVGAGLTNAGRDIASGYAPPSPSPNPTTGYTQTTRTTVSPGTIAPAATSPSYSSYVSSAAAADDSDAPTRTTNPSNYGTSTHNTLTATYPGVGLVDLGVPIIGQQSTETTDSPTRFRTSTSPTPPLQSAERISIMQTKRQQVN